MSGLPSVVDSGLEHDDGVLGVCNPRSSLLCGF